MPKQEEARPGSGRSSPRVPPKTQLAESMAWKIKMQEENEEMQRTIREKSIMIKKQKKDAEEKLENQRIELLRIQD